MEAEKPVYLVSLAAAVGRGALRPGPLVGQGANNTGKESESLVRHLANAINPWQPSWLW